MAVKKAKAKKPVGQVTHYFGKLKVGIIKFKKPIKAGIEIHIKGATTDFKQTIDSMQYDHKEIKAAKSGKEVGIKLKKKVREGDAVYV
jgi:U32 family peptidase